MFRFKKNKTSASSATSEKDGKKNKSTLKQTKDENKRENETNSASSITSQARGQTSAVDAPSEVIEPNINLSRDELLKLLSVFEGELQARDEVIAILKSECSQTTDMRYGLTSQPLKALRRDAITLDITSQDHVCEQTKEQLKKIIQHQKQSYKKLKEMHLSMEEKNQRLSTELEEEKRKHQEYMIKSDDFVNLVEHDRERLKQMFDQEKTSFGVKERELVEKLKENKEEVARLKALSLELVEDRQQQMQISDEQNHLIGSLEKQMQEFEIKLQEKDKKIASEKEHALQLENELEEQGNMFFKKKEQWSVELSEEKSKSKDLEEKVRSLGRQLQKLKCVDKNLRKTDDQLWRIKEKLEQEEKYEDLLEEVELLRKTVAGMQEAEKIYTQAQEESDQLRRSLEKELTQVKMLREEVEKLRKSYKNKTEMERCIEEAQFRFDELEQKYQTEYTKQNKMKEQLEEYQTQLKKIDESETLIKFNEMKIRQLQASVRDLKEEKNGLETKLQIEQDKSAQLQEMMQDDQNKITEVTQKAIEESKKVLKAKGELNSLNTKHLEEINSLQKQLHSAKETIAHMITKEKAEQMENLITHLRKQLAILKKRLDQLEGEFDSKEKELQLAKEETENARRNLNTSTEHLRRLVALGLEQQIDASKAKHMKESISKKYVENLQEEVANIEKQLKQNITPGNANNNNVYLKNVMTSHVSTQTCANCPAERNLPPRRMSRLNSYSGTESKPPPMRRTASFTRKDETSDRARPPFKTGIVTSKRASSSSGSKETFNKNLIRHERSLDTKGSGSSENINQQSTIETKRNLRKETPSSVNATSEINSKSSLAEGKMAENKKNGVFKKQHSDHSDAGSRLQASPVSTEKSKLKKTSHVKMMSKLYANSSNPNGAGSYDKISRSVNHSNSAISHIGRTKSRDSILTGNSSIKSKMSREGSNQSVR